MKKKKYLAMGLSLVLAAGLVAGCGNSGEKESASNGGKKDKVKISMLLGAVETVDWYNEKIKEFNDANPDIQVQAEFQKEATNTLKIKLASNDAPDIVSSVAIPQELFDQGYFKDLANESYWGRMDPSVKEITKDKNGKNYTLPLVQMYFGMFYNKDIFKELGLKEATTFQEFENNLKTVKAKKPDVVPFYQGGKESWTFGQQFIYVALGDYQQKYGAAKTKAVELNNDKSVLKLDAPGGPAETYAKDWLEMQKLGLINDNAVTATYDSQLEAMAKGKAAFITQGMWALGDILKKNPQSKDFIGFQPFPGLMPDGKPSVLAGPDGNLVISASSKHQAEIKKFLDYLTSPDVAKSFSAMRGAPSVFKDAQTDWSVLSKDVSDVAGRVPNIDWGAQPTGYTWDEMGKTIQELLVGAYTPEEFSKKFQELWDKGFVKNKVYSRL